MREPRLARDGGQRASGVIDTLSAGYGIVNQRIWIILIPILLDLFLWLGPQVSVSPLVGQALTHSGLPTGLTAEQAQALDQTRRGVLSAADDFNLLSVLSPGVVGVPVAVPSVMVLLRGDGPFHLLDSWGAALGILAGTLLGGMALGCAYYATLAQQVREGVVSLERSLWAAWRAWRQVLGLLLVLAGLAALLGVPVAFALASAALMNPAVASFGVAFVMVALVWVQFYLFFAPEAIFLSQVGPLEAIKRSVTLVRSSFWQAVLLISLIWVILLGMSQVWLWLAGMGSPGGRLVGIVGNAYIATGLAAASMVFYQERSGRKEKALG